jgi:hypothetical protein
MFLYTVRKTSSMNDTNRMNVKKLNIKIMKKLSCVIFNNFRCEYVYLFNVIVDTVQILNTFYSL